MNQGIMRYAMVHDYRASAVGEVVDRDLARVVCRSAVISLLAPALLPT